jgi:hypothetical protein
MYENGPCVPRARPSGWAYPPRALEGRVPPGPVGRPVDVADRRDDSSEANGPLTPTHHHGRRRQKTNEEKR